MRLPVACIQICVAEEDYSEELADYDDPEDDGPPWDEDDTESEDNE